MTAQAPIVRLMGLAGAVAAASGAILIAQKAPPQVFRAGVELVAVDVNVVDRNGEPVAGLRGDQFVVTIDGKVRRVATADFVDLRPSQDKSPEPDPRAAALRQFYSANDDAGTRGNLGRVILLAVDQNSFRPAGAPAAIAAIRSFLDRLPQADRVGLLTFPSPAIEVVPTRNRDAVRAALGKVMGGAEAPSSFGGPSRFNIGISEALSIAGRESGELGPVVARECANLRGPDLQYCLQQIQFTAAAIASGVEMQSLRSVRGLTDAMVAAASIREHKTLIIVSGGLITNTRPDGRAAFTSEIAEIGRMAAASNTNIYTLHLDSSFIEAFSAETGRLSPALFSDSAVAATGLETLAGASGGALFRVETGTQAAFDRVLRETSGYYLLGVEPEEGDRDGKGHRIRVTVGLPGVTLRSRREAILPRVSAGPPSPERAVADALTAGRLSSALPMRASAWTTARLADNAYQVLLSADIGDGLAGSADLQVGYVVTDAARGQLAPVVETARLSQRATGPPGSVSYTAGIVLGPGAYTVRLAAADPSGRVGSVEHGFVVRPMTSPSGLGAADLLLVDTTRGPNNRLAPISDGRVRGTAVLAYLEVSSTGVATVSQVTFGVADTSESDLLVSAPGSLVRKEKPGGFSAESRLDLAPLPPGDYVAVAIVTDDRGRETRVSRPFTVERTVGTAVGVEGPRAPIHVNATGALVRPFNREDVLRPDVVGFFLDQALAVDRAPLPDAVARSIESARRGRFDTTLAELADADPARLPVRFLRGLALLSKGDHAAAAVQFRAAVRVSPEFLAAAFYVGACLAAEGNDEEAAGAWQTSLVAENDLRIVYEVLADARLRLNDSAAAIDILTEARDRWPADDRWLPRLGAAYAAANRRDAAMASLRPYLDRHPAASEVLFLAMRLIYDAHAGGGVVWSADEDRELMARYAGLYRAAGGPNLSLVARWVQYVK